MPAPRVPVITFTTDFGEADPWAASMKGVALTLCPGARLVDLSHAVERGDLLGAALVVEEASRWFPPGSVHVVVVDPGVGTDRRALAVKAGGRFFTGPDNGVLWPVIDADPRARVHAVTAKGFRLAELSATFHGRDLFTPAAARLAAGRRIETAGARVTDPVRLEEFRCTRRGGRLEGMVLRVDRFGNLVTSVRTADLEAAFDGVPFPTLDIRVGGRRIDETAAAYGLARPEVPFAMVGSGKRLEVAIRDGSAAETLGVGRGAEVTVDRRGGRR